MKKGLKFTKVQLEELYLNQKLSLNQIGEKFSCEGTNILYWMKKLGIKRRPAQNPNSVYISKEILRDLYWDKRLKTQEVANEYGIKYGRSILKKMKKYGIPSKTLSQAMTTKFKKPFDNNLAEKSYFLGLRAGDFHAKKIKECIRVQTTTTHSAQIELLKNSFSKYGEICKYLSKSKSREDEWFIYVDLDKSFNFLIQKPNEIPSWILEYDELFFQFLAAYMDCEGNWHLTKTHDIHSRFTFRLRTGDKLILENINNKLRAMGFFTIFNLDTMKGSYGPCGIFRKDIYNVTMNRKNNVISLIKKLLPLSKHPEKIKKMELMLKYETQLHSIIKNKWNLLKEEINGQLLKNQIK
tara:strand:- start:13083 stop:14141 length:1059 start_codon:yes stop_codon:yes gene_type:complete